MGFCTGMAKGFLYVISFILGLSGLAVLGAGSYAKINYDDWGELFSNTGINIALISGAAIFVVAFLGCYGAKNQSKCALSSFFLVIFAFLVMQIIAAIMFASYMGKLDSVTSNSQAASDLADSTEIEINDFIYSLYDSCTLFAYSLNRPSRQLH